MYVCVYIYIYVYTYILVCKYVSVFYKDLKTVICCIFVSFTPQIFIGCLI